jgi:hypothetical protein
MAARDVLFIGSVLFVLGLGLFMLKFTSESVNDVMASSPLNESAQAISAMNSANDAVSKVDYIFIGVFIALTLGLIITGWFIAGNPIFIFFYFLIITVGVVVGAILSNTWEAFTLKPIFGTTIAALPMMNHVMLYLPYYLTAIGFIGMIVMFAKPKEGVEQYY